LLIDLWKSYRRALALRPHSSLLNHGIKTGTAVGDTRVSEEAPGMTKTLRADFRPADSSESRERAPDCAK
jgi:hypothetical protein